MTNFGDFRLTVFGQFNPTLTTYGNSNFIRLSAVHKKYLLMYLDAFTLLIRVCMCVFTDIFYLEKAVSYSVV